MFSNGGAGVFSSVKTEQYCLLRTEAFPLASETRIPSDCSGDTPHGSLRFPAS